MKFLVFFGAFVVLIASAQFIVAGFEMKDTFTYKGQIELTKIEALDLSLEYGVNNFTAIGNDKTVSLVYEFESKDKIDYLEGSKPEYTWGLVYIIVGIGAVPVGFFLLISGLLYKERKIE